MKIRIHPLPYAADVAFVIRDDDVSYFTPLERLDKVYRYAWNSGYKISFATVPSHRAIHGLNIPISYRGKDDYHPIYENKKLVLYLKEKISNGQVDIVQHGFCHTENSNLPIIKFDMEHGTLCYNNSNQKINLNSFSEFYNKNEKDVNSRVQRGKQILEDTFGIPIKVFVSPQELLTKPLWIALWKNNLDYCGGVGRNIIAQIPIKHINFYPLLKVAVKKLLKLNPKSIAGDVLHFSDIVTIPATYRHYWNNFTSDELAEYWFKHFKTIFEEKRQQRGYFILLTHYWEYFYDWKEEITQKRQYEYLNKILDYINNIPHVWKCSLSELIDWIKAINHLKFIKKGGALKIFSPYVIKGLCIPLNKIKIDVESNIDIKLIQKESEDFAVINLKAGGTVSLKLKK